MKTPTEALLALAVNRAEITEWGDLSRELADAVLRFNEPGGNNPQDMARSVLEKVRELAVKIPEAGEVESEELSLEEWDEANNW